MDADLKNLDLRALIGEVIESDGAGGWRIKTEVTGGLASEATLLQIRDAVKKATAGAVTRIAASVSSVQILAANADRISAFIVNESTSVLYLKYGATASATSYSLVLQENEIAIIDDYTGRIDGIWISATGNAQITENE